MTKQSGVSKILAGAVTGLLLLTACDAGSDMTGPMNAGVQPRFAATSQTTREVISPFVYTTLNPCTGEPVTITGTYRFAVKATEPTSGGTLIYVHTQIHGSGLGLWGYSYNGQNQELQTINSTPGMTATTTLVNNVALIRKGPRGDFLDDDFHLHITIHGTITPDGMPSAEVAKVRENCVLEPTGA